MVLVGPNHAHSLATPALFSTFSTLEPLSSSTAQAPSSAGLLAALRADNRAVEDDCGSSVEKVEKNAGVAREWAWLGPTSMVRLGGS